MQVEQLSVPGPFSQILVAGFQLINQFHVNGSNPQPDFSGGHFINGQLGTVLGHEVFEQLVSDVQILLKLLAAFLGVFAKHRQGAFVFTRREHFVIDVVFLQQAVNVGQLRHDPDRTQNGKRCADNLLADARHHVTAAGSHFIDAHRQRDTGLANTCQL